MHKQLTEQFLDFDLVIENASYYRSIGLLEVESPNIFKSSSTVFDEKGLFSTEIFGPIDSDLRFKKPGYINFKLPVLHPMIYRTLVTLGDKYKCILSGEKTAIFNKTTKDFELSEDGETGYKFFMDHIDQIVYPSTGSEERNAKIKLLSLYGKSKHLIDSFLVLPAGLRDYTVDKNGKPSEDEINTIYRKLIYFANNLRNKTIDNYTMDLYDGIRYNIQLILVEIYEYIKSLLDGKNKYVQGSWGGRAIDFATRNVVSGMVDTIYDIDVPEEGRIDGNTVAIGLFQFYKAINNIGASRFHNMISYKIFEENSSYCYGFNPDTYKIEKFQVEDKVLSKYTTLEGFDSLLNDFNLDDFKFSHFKIKGRYAMLKYEDGENIEFFFPMLGIKDGIPKDKLKPVTYIEALYVAIMHDLNKFCCTTTRFPIANYGSIIPNKIYVKTTTKGYKRNLIVGYDEKVVYEYPNLTCEAFRTLGPHITHLKAFTMDFDGDTATCTATVTQDGIDEVHKVLNDKAYYMDPNGNAAFSIADGVIDQTLRELSR